MKKPAVFIDRDGTVNEQVGYLNHVSRLTVFPWSAPAIKLLNDHHYLAVIVSNQSGVARGYFPVSLVNEVHQRIERVLEQEEAFVDDILFCPHHPAGRVPEFSKLCECRKPSIGLIERACERFDIDLAGSYVVGDQLRDIELAKRADIKGILVETGYGLGEKEYLLPLSALEPAYIAKDLLDAVRWILGEGRF